MRSRWMWLLCLGVTLGCGGHEEEQAVEFPPRTGAHDALAAKVADARLELRIDPEEPLVFSGIQELSGSQFVPVAGEFDVAGGELVSTLGPVTKRAQFGVWSYVEDAEGNVIGFGFDVVSGELVVPSVFTKEPPAGMRVANSYRAEDLGADYTLITLDPAEGHKVTIQSLMADGRGMFGSLRAKVEEATVSGEVRLEARPELLSPEEADAGRSFLTLTAACIGAKVEAQRHAFERRADGWYADEKRVSR